MHITWTPEKPGTYIFKAEADPDNEIEEEDETNNSVELKTEVRGHKYDWAVKEVNFLPLLPEEGDTLEFTARVANKGTMRLTTHLDLYVDGNKIKSLTVNTRPGAEEIFGDGYPAGDSLQWKAKEGGHKIKLVIDDPSADGDMSDNSIIKTLKVAPPPKKEDKPTREEVWHQKKEDERKKVLREAREKMEEAKSAVMEITGFAGVGSDLQIGKSRRMGAYFRNVSDKTLKNVEIELLVRNTQTRKHLAKYGVGGTRRTWPSVASGGKFQVLFPYKAVCPGRFRLTAKATVNLKSARKTAARSAYFNVPETGGKIPADYYRARGADLAIYAEDLIIVPENPDLGDEVAARITVRNDGALDIRQIEVQITANEDELHRELIPLIKAGRKETFSFTEKAEEKGSFHVKVRIDPDNRIAEVNEGNNETAMDIRVAGIQEQLEQRLKESLKSSVEQKVAPTIKALKDARKNAARVIKNIGQKKKELKQKKKELKELLGL